MTNRLPYVANERLDCNQFRQEMRAHASGHGFASDKSSKKRAMTQYSELTDTLKGLESSMYSWSAAPSRSTLGFPEGSSSGEKPGHRR